MKIAACSSITSARLARLTSMPISSRSTAAVESRSSHSAMARSVRLARLRAKARVDCARGPFAAVHVDRQSQHEADRVALRGDREQPRRIGLEGLALDGLDAGREPPVGIGHRDADGLGAEIETDQRAALGPVRRRLRSGAGSGRAWRKRIPSRGATQSWPLPRRSFEKIHCPHSPDRSVLDYSFQEWPCARPYAERRNVPAAHCPRPLTARDGFRARS